MVVLFFVVCCLLGFLNLNIDASDPMKCTEVSVNNIQYSPDEDNNLLMSANFKLFYTENVSTIVQVSNVIAWDYKEHKPATQICGVIYPPDCTSDFSKPYNVTVTDSNFNLEVDFVEDNGMFEEDLSFWYGFTDEGNFNHPDGTLFTPERACIENNYYDGYRLVQCCNTFAPVPKIPEGTNNPHCKIFKSRVSILNVDDNYSINATATLTIRIDDDGSIITGDFNYTEGVLFIYDLNNCGGIESNENPCYLPKSDYKSLLSVFIEPPATSEPVVGRWLVRNGQMLMAEGVPLTKANNCQYYNSPLDDNHIISSQFCCNSFALA